MKNISDRDIIICTHRINRTTLVELFRQYELERSQTVTKLVNIKDNVVLCIIYDYSETLKHIIRMIYSYIFNTL